MSREIDREVAEKVMGWRAVYISGKPGFACRGELRAQCEFMPSEDIAAAWLVVEKMVADGYMPTMFLAAGGLWQVYFDKDDESFKGKRPRIEEAICRAALEAVKQRA